MLIIIMCVRVDCVMLCVRDESNAEIQRPADAAAEANTSALGLANVHADPNIRLTSLWMRMLIFGILLHNTSC